MERPRWRRCCAFFAVSLVCLAGKLYTCGPVGAAAAGVADSSASLQSVDLAAGPLEGAEQNGQAQGALAGEGEQPNREAANFQEEPYEVQRDDPLFNENRSAAGARGTSASFVLKNMITFALTVAIVFLSARIIWDIMNFVGDVPDPFAHVQSSQDIPAAIEDLLEQGNPVAFVIRRCKYCGLGLRAMKNAGYSPLSSVRRAFWKTINEAAEGTLPPVDRLPLRVLVRLAVGLGQQEVGSRSDLRLARLAAEGFFKSLFVLVDSLDGQYTWRG
ncbi:hypothetical protein Efla_003122 [Eimeria flavescens]